jgi:hypothetical protein
MSLVLGIDPTGRDLSPYRTDMGKVGKVTLGRYPTFDGSTGYLIKNVADWRSADSFGTIVAWVKLNAVGADQGILCSGDEATGSHYFGAMIDSTNKAKIIATISGGGTAIAGNTTWTASVWRHLAFVSSGTAWWIYINGVEDTPYTVTVSNTGNWFADVLNRDNFTIGALKINVLAWYANGSIAYPRVYSDIWTPARVKNDYRTTRQHLFAA